MQAIKKEHQPRKNILAGNVSRVLVVTNGSANSVSNAQNIIGNPAVPADGVNPAVPATGLFATFPNVQFAIASDPTVGGGLNDDQTVFVFNPTQDYITAGDPANTIGYNLTRNNGWSNSLGNSSQPLPSEPVYNNTIPLTNSVLPDPVPADNFIAP